MAMNTRFDLIMVDIGEEIADTVFKDIQEVLKRLELKLSYFNKDSEVYQINQKAFKDAVKLDDEMFEILQLCINYSKNTAGAFDITSRPLLDLLRSNIDPDKNSIQELGSLLGTDKLIIEPIQKSIRYSNEKVKIDLGGFGKGYAMQKVLDILKKYLIKNAFISFGGSSVSGIGKHPHGTYWPAGIQNVYKPEQSIFSFKLNNESFSTSGWNLKQEFHIINSSALSLNKEKKTISVVSSSALETEVLSTAFANAGEEQKKIIIENFPKCNFVEVLYNEKQVEKIIEYANSTRPY